MKAFTYITWGVWAVVALTLSFLKIVSWWVGFSWLWLPLGALFSMVLIVFVMASFSQKFLPKDERKRENCMHQKAADEISKTADHKVKCLGENCGKHCPCEYYEE